MEKPAAEAVAAPDVAHNLTQAKELLYGGRPGPGQEHLFGSPSLLRTQHLDDAIAHLQQVPGSEKAVRQMQRFRDALAAPADPEFWDKPSDLFWSQAAAEHGIDELANQHGVPRILNPAERVGGFRHDGPTPILDDLYDEHRLMDIRRLAPSYTIQEHEAGMNFKQALQQHLQDTGQTEHGIMADWLHGSSYSPDLNVPGASQPLSAFDKLLQQHSPPENPDLLGHKLSDHLEKYP
jgi:hypothetical protein